jgi:hypothetical protein
VHFPVAPLHCLQSNVSLISFLPKLHSALIWIASTIKSASVALAL